MAAKILLVDDEPAIRRLLRNTLERAGHEVIEAANARDALAAASAVQPDAVLLDLGLPDRDGLALIPLLRRDADTRILIISAREATEEKVAALDLGADDFVTKPFDTDELLARLRVALRHHGGAAAAKLVCTGDLRIDLDRRLVSRAAAELHLTRKEHDVLAMLARHVGRVVTHEKLIAAAWRGDEDPRIDYLRIVIRNLRQKVEAPGPIGSVIGSELGVGYRLRADV
ncbi:response regulator transcription factor [Sphingomonas dokdonensis]|uniref:KDP operon transcriptional regulatory protein KdpE n=1 Tax=Sphingomonas dokdonensis TaxID=344880 RepID=A0A245ZVD8_9SPHN|nr:response regulator transcription factor [Sphingomonas dokdonensis]OWK33682.1 KDP operon transcriptional regulatory protein KdpE [Sphingomonas dokdonensis]